MKIILVTGGARGIGKGISEELAKDKSNIIIVNYHTSEDNAKDLKNKYDNIDIYKADITNIIEVKNMINYIINKYKKIDVVINNAGISQTKLFQDITYEEWDRMIATNLSSNFYICKEVIPYMIKEHEGNIINISSIWGMVGGACEVHYSASKARYNRAVKGISKRSRTFKY